ncbi:hypothetical protein C0Q70_18102 [Pomacea canaliculata]|uniref:Uncharacterized protein n=1 Tax=Pomacea canaliculata TaxID=400727 RepID=A0A2T7NM98_POMCA|nr:hypothetical protein C0Q70_18102 [Pomacea canaliculata]
MFQVASLRLIKLLFPRVVCLKATAPYCVQPGEKRAGSILSSRECRQPTENAPIIEKLPFQRYSDDIVRTGISVTNACENNVLSLIDWPVGLSSVSVPSRLESQKNGGKCLQAVRSFTWMTLKPQLAARTCENDVNDFFVRSSNSIFPWLSTSREELGAYKETCQYNWEQFLHFRARELKLGGVLFVAQTLRPTGKQSQPDSGHRETGTHDTLVDLDLSWKTLYTEGLITEMVVMTEAALLISSQKKRGFGQRGPSETAL